ncbi:hypothetical protein BC629DRAFT_1598635 [Irpex lacteus]|nr:hypothetical protein BC629DRAFT_1598635 [Irpex lacteus]
MAISNMITSTMRRSVAFIVACIWVLQCGLLATSAASIPVAASRRSQLPHRAQDPGPPNAFSGPLNDGGIPGWPFTYPFRDKSERQ